MRSRRIHASAWLGGLLIAAASVSLAAENDAAPAWRWRLEGRAGEGAEATFPGEDDAPPLAMIGDVRTSEIVPAPYVYDPVTAARSPANRASATLDGTNGLILPGPKVVEFLADENGVAKSFTLEILFRAIDGGQGPIVTKLADSPDAGTWSLAARTVGGNLSFFGGSLAQGECREEATTGHYLSRSNLSHHDGWNHAALIHDAEARTVRVVLNYYEDVVWKLDAPLRVDAGDLVFGKAGDRPGFVGAIDEVRLSATALPPARFLRPRWSPVQDVQFDPGESIFPADYGAVNVKEAFGAVGDGRTDDTEAFRAAFRELADKVPLDYATLYVPPGTYRLTDTIRWTRFLVVQGAGSERTTFRLDDGASGFDDPIRPRAVLAMGWTEWGEWGSGAGNVIGNYLIGVGVDSGKRNPGAIGLDHHSNNHGVVRDVAIRSGDGQGQIGLSFVRPWPGPALIQDVRIEGFDRGIEMQSQEYSMTLERIELRGQKTAGILVGGNILAARGIKSDNAAPAIVMRGGNSMLTLLESELVGGSAESPAIRADGAVYLRDVRCDGYGTLMEKRARVPAAKLHPADPAADARRPDDDDPRWNEVQVSLPGPYAPEYVGDFVVCPRGVGAGSLKLLVEETPEVPWGDVARDWRNVREFESLATPDDWTAAIQAAIDSGARTVYFPAGDYPVKGTVRVRGPVERLFGTMKIGLARPGDFPSTEPLLVFDDPDPAKVVSIERLRIEEVRHDSPGTLVMRDSGCERFTNGPRAGKLFLENDGSIGWKFSAPLRVWCRQWNPEAHGPGPVIESDGAAVWSLGFKTEYESSKLWATNGAKTELLGAFVYPVNSGIPDDRPIFKNVDSEMAVIYGTSVYVADHVTHVIDTRAGETLTTSRDALYRQGSRFRMDLYTSDPFPLATERN